MLLRLIILLLLPILFCNCNAPTVNAPASAKNNTAEAIIDSTTMILKSLNIPSGLKIELFATNVENARSIAISPSGVVFVGTRDKGDVYAVVDTDGDHKADKKYVLMTKGNMPNGVAFRDGDLYVAEVSRILKFEDIESKLSNPGKPIVVYDKYPTESHHGWKFISFGPDGKLYVPVGAPCNICESKKEIYNSITRINADGTGLEIVQGGIRNSVGFTWDATDKTLWFTDNGRDMMGEDIPACELNHAAKDHENFGYPYCHQGDTPDPEYGSKHKCSEFVPPVQKLGAHVAPLGVEFANTTLIGGAKNRTLLIAEHGSWNRKKKSGYRVTMVEIDQNNKAISYKPFISGWLNEATDEVSGRPVDMEYMSDGSMLLSDDYANVIYRISKKN